MVDAVVDAGFSAGGIWASAAAGAKVGAVVGSWIPIVGTLAGAIIGIAAGFVFDKVLSEVEFNDKTAKDWVKAGMNKVIDNTEDKYSEESIARRVENSHKR